MGGDPFRIFAARRYTPDDLALLTDEEEQILLGPQNAHVSRNSPPARAVDPQQAGVMYSPPFGEGFFVFW